MLRFIWIWCCYLATLVRRLEVEQIIWFFRLFILLHLFLISILQFPPLFSFIERIFYLFFHIIISSIVCPCVAWSSIVAYSTLDGCYKLFVIAVSRTSLLIDRVLEIYQKCPLRCPSIYSSNSTSFSCSSTDFHSTEPKFQQLIYQLPSQFLLG